ncbi:uncharacterized protein LOC105686049 [Athalia rosae]|uniref:uncharacterized protein LOC105686049 n=1 Tax=Athalia rosae TaxID=37344 RepID=UPI002033B768|nr:uncharacterized protein LOC105686049 [Athalia rosae]
MKGHMILLVVAIFSVFAEINASEENKWKENIEKWGNECAKEMKLTPEQLEEYRSTDGPPDDKPGSCYLACVLQKAELMEDHVVHKDKVHDIMTEISEAEGIEGLVEISDKCVETADEETDACIAAAAIAECLYENIAELKKKNNKE